MHRVHVCAECGKPLRRVALTNLVVSYEPDDEDDELFEQLWHRACFVQSQQEPPCTRNESP